MIKKIIGLKVLILPLSLALFVIIAILYVKPLFSEMTEKRRLVLEEQKQLNEMQSQYQKLSQLKSSWQSIEEKGIIETALPQDESTEKFLAEFYQRAARSGVVMNNFVSSGNVSEISFCATPGESAVGAGGATDSGSAQAETVASSENLPQGVSASLPSASLCPKGLLAQISINGSWGQLLDFLKYSADSNRIANLKKLAISPVAAASGSAENSGEQLPSDVLSASISIEAYYQAKGSSGNTTTLSALTKQAGFSKDVLNRVKEIVYAPYEAPLVSETEERNIFK